MYVLVLLLNLSCKFEMNGTIKDGILMVAVTLQIRKKKSELLLNSKYYFDFLSSNIKFRTAETQTAFLDASPETISFLLCTSSHLLSDSLLLLEQLEQGFPKKYCRLFDLRIDKFPMHLNFPWKSFISLLWGFTLRSKP